MSVVKVVLRLDGCELVSGGGIRPVRVDGACPNLVGDRAGYDAAETERDHRSCDRNAAPPCAVHVLTHLGSFPPPVWICRECGEVIIATRCASLAVTARTRYQHAERVSNHA